MKIDLDQIKELIDIVSNTSINELVVESGNEKIGIKKGPSGVPVVHSPETHAHHAPAHTKESHAQAQTSGNNKHGEADKNENLIAITSPMVGTFYRASSPTATPYVDIGDKISVGQTVCIIEAMKLMNDLPSEIAGRIVKVCADNGKTVEFGQQLFLVDPAG